MKIILRFIFFLIQVFQRMNLEEPLNSPKYNIADQHVKKLLNGYELDVKRSSSGHDFTNFPNTNLRIFSTKYYVHLVKSKLRKMPCLTNKEFVFFFNWEILGEKFVDSYLENSWKHVLSSIIDSKLKGSSIQFVFWIKMALVWKYPTNHLE